MSDNSDLISVILPVYNGERFLAEAIESALRQEYTRLEIIVVDDGSVDGTRGIAQSFGSAVTYIYQPNGGPPAARNTGLQRAGGTLIAFLDADDVWPAGKLTRQYYLLKQHPGVEVTLGFARMIVPSGSGGEVFEPWMEPVPSICLGCGLFRASAFEKIGLFDESLAHADDVDWFFRAREGAISMLTHRDVMLLYRRHGNNITNDRELDTHYVLTALKKSLDRRREGSVGSAPPLPGWSDLG
jgi:glycosyltransferase involved in cell wall biosynthesis